MHRATPLNSSFRAFTSGGARSVVDKVNDGTLMQEMAGNFMKGETRNKIESPQNYGFTSVVLPAKKGKDGQITESAEAFISFMGGNRSFPVAAIMDDRRHRPMGLRPGENSQYDDIGQMTLMRRNGLFLLTLDSEDESQQQQGGGATPTAEGGGGKKVERMVSLRHVEKKKQERQKSQSQGSGDGASGGQQTFLTVEQQEAQDEAQQKKHEQFKHEGESVNTEIRLTKNRIEFRVGDTVVGYYDKGAQRWSFTGEIKLGDDEKAKHPVYGVGDSGTGMVTKNKGKPAVLIVAEEPGPPTSLDTAP